MRYLLDQKSETFALLLPQFWDGRIAHGVTILVVIRARYLRLDRLRRHLLLRRA